ncbi:hypothetical protein RZE82_08745 [Mollicutes bacterium LVI A0039]|nr:hypothetical protein RZE82_08745 [Mollicutes bacterium LVI A0039]
MIEKVIVGVNSTGKSEYLNKLFEEDLNPKKIFIPTESILDEEVKSANKIKGTFLIDNILPIIFEEISIDMEDEKEKLSTVINSAIEQTDNEIVKKFRFNEKWKYEKLIENDIKEEFKNLGSGDKSKYILEILVGLDLSEYSIYIDEPEKFAHPNLQVKISGLLNNLSKNNKVYLVTHSPIVIKHLDIKSLSNILIFDNEGKKRLSDSELENILESISDRNSLQLYDSNTNSFNNIEHCTDFLYLNYEEFKRFYFIEIYKKLIFFSKVIFLEDENTKVYLESVNKHGFNKDIDFLNVGGKVMLLIWKEVATKLNINFGVVFDSDERLEYDAKKKFTGHIQKAELGHLHYNKILKELKYYTEITVDIEYSVLADIECCDNEQEQFTKNKMSEIIERKTRIDTRLKLKKKAEAQIGKDIEAVKNLISSM